MNSACRGGCAGRRPPSGEWRASGHPGSSTTSAPRGRRRPGVVVESGVVDDLAVEEADHPVGRARPPGVVGDQQDGLAAAVQPAEQLEHLSRALAVEAPVGSSASSRRRARWPAPGPWPPAAARRRTARRAPRRPCRRGRAGRAGRARASRPLARGRAGESAGQLDVLRDGHASSRLKNWKTMPICRRRSTAQRALAQRVDALPASRSRRCRGVRGRRAGAAGWTSRRRTGP